MSGPLRLPRLVTLSLAFIFAVIAACVGLNALIKSDRSKTKFKKLAPAPAVVDIDTNNIFTSGLIVTIANVVLAVFCFVFIVASVLPATRACCGRTLRYQALALLVPTLVIFASMIPYEIFYNTRGAIVKAYIGSAQLPASVVQSVEKATGVTNSYKQFNYLKLLAVFPWFTVLFSLIAIVTLFTAGMKAAKEADVPPKAGSIHSVHEKESASHNEPETTTNV